MLLVGQHKLRDTIKKVNSLNGLTILLGPYGSGRTTISKWIADYFGYKYIVIDNKIADIRQMINDTMALNEHTIYFIRDADNMTLQAMNAMLKIAEEPPKNLHIILGIVDTDNTLETIISRSNLYTMDYYMYDEIVEYYKNIGNLSMEHEKELLQIASTPGMLKKLIQYDFDKCYEYVQLVYDNVLKVSTGNAFKIGNKIGFKGEEDLIPIDVFFLIYLEVLRSRIIESCNRPNGKNILSKQIQFTTKALKDITRKGSNKKLIFDVWTLNIRTLRNI